MQPTTSWYQTLAWTFFVRQGAAILALLSIILWVAYSEAERGVAEVEASLDLGVPGQEVGEDGAVGEEQNRHTGAGAHSLPGWSLG